MPGAGLEPARGVSPPRDFKSLVSTSSTTQAQNKGNENRDLSQQRIPWWKRPLDIIVSVLALIITSPLWLLIAVAIKLEDGGPVFFLHERPGYMGRPFKLIKFRTMVVNAEEKLKEILDKNPELKKEWEKCFKLERDPRLTRVGRLLRKTSLDELPQFINVLKGDMSVVGPRPILKEELEERKKYKDWDLFFRVKPGITGYWQVKARNIGKSYEEKVEMDNYYVKNMSLILDLKIMLKTVLAVFKGKGV